MWFWSLTFFPIYVDFSFPTGFQFIVRNSRGAWIFYVQRNKLKFPWDVILLQCFLSLLRENESSNDRAEMHFHSEKRALQHENEYPEWMLLQLFFTSFSFCFFPSFDLLSVRQDLLSFLARFRYLGSLHITETNGNSSSHKKTLTGLLESFAFDS